jgi:hypothetical protein
MTQAHEAADAIRRMAKFYQNMQFAADTLERIGSLVRDCLAEQRGRDHGREAERRRQRQQPMD